MYSIPNAVTITDGYEVQSENWRLESVNANVYGANLDELTNDAQPVVQIGFIVSRQSEAYIYQVIIPAVVLISINILVLFLDPLLHERIILFFINLFSHEVYLEQLHYM